jgi:hypothetical protein
MPELTLSLQSGSVNSAIGFESRHPSKFIYR